jgi:hypothetical protein
MQPTKIGAPRRAPTLLAGIVAAIISFGPAHAACDFGVVKQQIDAILDRDAEKAAKFRREVASGSDSIAVIESLVASDVAAKVDICRFETAEYLTKRGFPPFH